MKILVPTLAYLYPDSGSIRRVTTIAGLDVRNIDMEGPALEVWTCILAAEIKQGKKGRMWVEAMREFPDNPDIVQAGLHYVTDKSARAGMMTRMGDEWLTEATGALEGIRTDIALIKADNARMREDISEIKQKQQQQSPAWSLMIGVLFLVVVVILLVALVEGSIV